MNFCNASECVLLDGCYGDASKHNPYFHDDYLFMWPKILVQNYGIHSYEISRISRRMVVQVWKVPLERWLKLGWFKIDLTETSEVFQIQITRKSAIFCLWVPQSGNKWTWLWIKRLLLRFRYRQYVIYVNAICT